MPTGNLGNQERQDLAHPREREEGYLDPHFSATLPLTPTKAGGRHSQPFQLCLWVRESPRARRPSWLGNRKPAPSW